MMSKKVTEPRVLVIGDIMLDRYTFGQVERISPEMPVPVLQANSVDCRAGGAANVAAMCQALGLEVTLAGVTGDDADGRCASSHSHVEIDCVQIRDLRSLPLHDSKASLYWRSESSLGAAHVAR